MKADSETKFLSGLIELQYGENVGKGLKKIAQQVSWAKGWPENNQAFWNAEAFMWGRKISKEKRGLIKDELAFLAQGKNLDLGCGAYSYVRSVGLDLSEKMLDFNEHLTEKIKSDLETKLPVKNKKFDSVTAVFVLNYVQKYSELLIEIKRVLKEKGVFIMVLSSKPINCWQKQKEVNEFSAKKWKQIVSRAGFNVVFYERKGLWFFRCRKSGQEVS